MSTKKELLQKIEGVLNKKTKKEIIEVLKTICNSGDEIQHKFSCGERVEVICSDVDHWEEHIFIGMYKDIPIVLDCDDERRLKDDDELDLCVYKWDKIRPVKKYKTITIDGKDIKMSKESFENLKEQLCK